jgi:hypothetical protein
MNLYKRLVLFFIFLFITQTLAADFNIFQQRKIVIGEFQNLGDPDYDYISESLGTRVYTYFILIPFITVDDDERAFLEDLSKTKEFNSAFIEAGDVVGYRLSPDIEQRAFTGIGQPYSERSWPMYVYGSYKVLTEDDTRVSLYVYNSMTGRLMADYKTQTTLYSLLNEPHTYLIPFFKHFLKYTIYTATIETEPEDSLIFIDERLVGIGSAQNILIPRGQHRLTIKSDGYRDYTDFINVTDDGFYSWVELKETEAQRTLMVVTDPSEADVYLNDEFLGKTPLEINLSEGYQTMTFVKEGYDRLIVSTTNLSPDEKTLNLKLVTSKLTQDRYLQAETHLKRAKILSYTGVGLLGVSIFLGTEKTLYDQKADLYRGTSRYEDSRQKANLFTYLTIASSIITGGIFTFSFMEMIRYFNRYGETPGGADDQKPLGLYLEPSAGYPIPSSRYTGTINIELFKAEVKF